MSRLRRRVSSAVRRFRGTHPGPEVHKRPLGPNAWLVQTRPGPRRLTPLKVGAHGWFLEPRRFGKRRVIDVGPPAARAHLLVDAREAENDPRRLQQGLANVAATEHIAWMLRELDVSCVLDVGANVGQYARSLRRSGYTGRIVSFEPLKQLADELRKAAADDPDWHVMPYALGDEEGETEFNVVPGTMSSMLPSSDFGKQWASVLREMHTETVTIRRLDGLFDEAVDGLEDPRVYLKMDTQGYDLQTFAGAGERIRDVVGMQSEVACVPIYDGMPRLPQQIEVYESAGFELTGMFPVTIDKASLRVIEFDAVMIRPDSLRGSAT